MGPRSLEPVRRRHRAHEGRLQGFDGSRTVTGPLGDQTVYKFTTLQNSPKVTEIDPEVPVTGSALIIGQFGLPIPLSAFTQQAGTNVYQYNDASGLASYWISSLTIDLDANQFTATAAGIVLAGLPNPFAVQMGTDAASACGVIIVQSTSPGQYQWNSSAGTQPCAISAPPVADPHLVPVGSATKVFVSIAVDGPDAQSARLFRADDNAQPVGTALCAFTDNGDGTLSCAASVNEASAGVIPLVVQASAGGQPVVAPGFSIRVVNPLSDADMRQLEDIHNLMLNTGSLAYSQFGDSVDSRVLVLNALRQYMQAPPGLTGQPVALSPDGWELGVQCDS
jgi:hypothetical protein